MIPRVVLVFLCCLVAAGPVNAQASNLTLMGASAGPSYTGPIDIVANPTGLWDLDAGSAAIAAAGTQSIVDLRRASDNATCTATIAASGGAFDPTVKTPCNGNTQTVTAWVGASSALVTKWYDQSGNGKDASQATAAQQPQLLLSGGANNLPYVKFVRASNQGLATGAITAPSQPWSVSAVAERTGTFTNFAMIVAIPSNNLGLRFNSSANTADITSTTVLTKAATDSAWHAFQGLFSGASSVISVDGAEATGNAGVVASSSPIMLGLATFNNNPLDGNIALVGVWPVGFTAGNRSDLQAIEKARYGTP